jgi:hypothetical protein
LWRQAIVPPDDPPKELRGQTIRVTFSITAEGRSENVTVDPVIRDKGFERKLRERMLAYLWKPARGPDGLPIPSSYTMSFTFY